MVTYQSNYLLAYIQPLEIVKYQKGKMRGQQYYVPELEIASRRIITIAKQELEKLDEYVRTTYEKIQEIEKVR